MSDGGLLDISHLASQRIHAAFGAEIGRRCPSCRVGAFARRERVVPRRASAEQHRRQAVVPLVAPRLVVDPIRLLVLPAHFLLHGPRFRPRRRILDRHGVLERLRVHARPAFDQVQVLARALEVDLRREVRDVDDQRVAFPVAARVAEPLPDRRREVRALLDRDDALPPLALADVVEDRHGSGRLHDPAVAAEVGQHRRPCSARSCCGPRGRRCDSSRPVL